MRFPGKKVPRPFGLPHRAKSGSKQSRLPPRLKNHQKLHAVAWSDIRRLDDLGSPVASGRQLYGVAGRSPSWDSLWRGPRVGFGIAFQHSRAQSDGIRSVRTLRFSHLRGDSSRSGTGSRRIRTGRRRATNVAFASILLGGFFGYYPPHFHRSASRRHYLGSHG